MVVVGCGELVQSALAVFREIDDEAGVAQQFQRDFLVQVVVFHQQDAGAFDRGKLRKAAAGCPLDRRQPGGQGGRQPV